MKKCSLNIVLNLRLPDLLTQVAIFKSNHLFRGIYCTKTKLFRHQRAPHTMICSTKCASAAVLCIFFAENYLSNIQSKLLACGNIWKIRVCRTKISSAYKKVLCKQALHKICSCVSMSQTNLFYFIFCQRKEVELHLLIFRYL